MLNGDACRSLKASRPMSAMRPRTGHRSRGDRSRVLCASLRDSGTCCSLAHRQPRAHIRGPCRRLLVSTHWGQESDRAARGSKRDFLLDSDLFIGTVEKSRVQAFHFCKSL
eukprot:3974844-Prymnesium_polylepis.1